MSIEYVALPSSDGHIGQALFLKLEIGDDDVPGNFHPEIDGIIAAVTEAGGGRRELLAALKKSPLVASASLNPDDDCTYIPFYRFWNEHRVGARSFWVMFDDRIYVATNIPSFYLEFYCPNDKNEGYILIDQEKCYTLEAKDYHSLEDGSIIQVKGYPVMIPEHFARLADKLARDGFKIELF